MLPNRGEPSLFPSIITQLNASRRKSVCRSSPIIRVYLFFFDLWDLKSLASSTLLRDMYFSLLPDFSSSPPTTSQQADTGRRPFTTVVFAFSYQVLLSYPLSSFIRESAMSFWRTSTSLSWFSRFSGQTF